MIRYASLLADGLAAEQIPLGARIIAACDAFIAMTSPRSHAAERTLAEAVAEVRRCSGTQFDPAVVEAVCELVAAPPPLLRQA